MDNYSVIGKSLPRVEGIGKATGTAIYTGDVTLPGMLHGKILRSPHAHARIVKIDTSQALRLPGVKAVITGADIPRVKYGIVPFGADEYALAIAKVRFIGDEVAAVAAVDEETALEAVELITVEYAPLPAVFDPETAMLAGAPLIHEDRGSNNITASIVKEFGDSVAGFAAAEYIREDRFATQGVGHAPLEPHVSVANYEASGKLTIWSSKQNPFYLRRNLAKTLQIPERLIRVIKPQVGGGFGGKLDLFAHDFCSSFLSKVTGKPVKIDYSREESLCYTRGRHPTIIKLRTGVKKDGSIVAQEYTLIADGGAYTSTAPVMIMLSAYFTMLPYIIPNLTFNGYRVYTNKMPNGAMRGHGIPQIRFACESQLDEIALDLGLSPYEIRVRNAVRQGEEHPAKLTISSCGFSESLELADQSMSGQQANRSNLLTGVGLGSSGFLCGANMMSHSGAGAIVKIDRDGSVTLLTGAADIGQGSDTVLSQIVAEVLGVPLEDIRVTAADTELTPHDSGTFGSGVTFRAGLAAQKAAQNAREKILEVVSQQLEVAGADLEFKDRQIAVKGSPERGMSLLDALKAIQYAEQPMPVVGRGFYSAPTVEPATLLKENGDLSPAYSFGTQAAKVVVDTETGEVKVPMVYTAHDCGRALNPMAVEGQLEGSVLCGLGQVLYEHLVSEQGQIMNPSFLDYKIPTALEMPEIGSTAIETNDPVGPFGSKESGEGTLVFTLPAIANAIRHAIGVRINELPITPEKILRALEQKNGKKG